MQGHENPAWRVLSGSAAQQLANDFLKSAPKVPGEGGVNEGVDGRVAVAEPKDDGKCHFGNTVIAESRDEVHGEKGKPTADETSHDDTQCFGSFSLHSKTPNL